MMSRMLQFRDIASCLLGAAVVLDAALLLVLAEGRHRRRLTAALLVLTGGALLFHLGFFGSLLFSDVASRELPWLRRAWQIMVATGALIMPSALLHWLARLYRSGLDPRERWNPRLLLAYLPLVTLPFILSRSEGWTQEGGPAFGTPYILGYVLFVAAVNVAAAVGLFLLRKKEELRRARRMFGMMGGALLASTVLLFARAAAPFGLGSDALEIVWLTAVLSPVLLTLVFGYFVVRFNFMQIVIERSMLYAVMLLAVALIYHFFWQRLWGELSASYRVDLSILAAAVLIVLILLVEPARKRISESLRYLFGERMARLRMSSRRLALAMSRKTGEPEGPLVEWFCEAAARVLGCSHVAAWTLQGGEIITRGGDFGRLEDGLVRDLHRQMIDEGFTLSTRRFWNTPLSEKVLIAGDASMLILLDHDQVSGLFLFGRTHAHSLNEEQITAAQMLVEQLGITMANGILQRERLIQERRLGEQAKLSMMGMVASAVVHEVKNPLSSIKTLTTLLAEALGPDSRYAEELTLIQGEVDRLSRTVTGMLSAVRPTVDRGETTALEEFLSGAVRLMRHMAKKRGVSLTLENGAPVPEIRAASDAVREILFNLIGNAIDAAEASKEERGAVVVRIAVEEGRVTVFVEDNGPGIDPADRDGVFEPFYTTKADGTGLGLAIARERAEAVGARLEHRAREGGGTVFAVGFDALGESGVADEERQE